MSTTYTPVRYTEGLGGWGDSWDGSWGEEAYVRVTSIPLASGWDCSWGYGWDGGLSRVVSVPANPPQ